MSNDESTFIREVNEELRSDAVKAVWSRWRFAIIGLCIAAVIGTAGYEAYSWWRAGAAAKSGDQFLAALELARAGKSDEALSAFEALEKNGHGAYPVLADLRAATVIADKGDKAAAADAFLAVANKSSVPGAIRDIARLRAGYLLVDTASYDDVSAAVELLAVPGNPARHSAREILGLAAYKAGDMARASDWFKAIADDTESPANISQRAGMFLDLIAAKGDQQ